ncbi:MAG: flagellar FlbD family protein [Spirochaetes bacterium]|nr:flagellar FlbD family protein [Spirochaetota bacterium]MBN2771532.1 flagellar FlbD family protein [Spirochaetota bacterium]
MIEVHRLNGTAFYINCDHIETMEETPDTVIHLTNDKTYVVTEKAEEIIDRIIAYKNNIVKPIIKKNSFLE